MTRPALAMTMFLAACGPLRAPEGGDAMAVASDAQEAATGRQDAFLEASPPDSGHVQPGYDSGQPPGCGAGCPQIEHGVMNCVGGRCVASCFAGWGSCVTENGCESTLNSPLFCGSCYNRCAPTWNCFTDGGEAGCGP